MQSRILNTRIVKLMVWTPEQHQWNSEKNRWRLRTGILNLVEELRIVRWSFTRNGSERKKSLLREEKRLKTDYGVTSEVLRLVYKFILAVYIWFVTKNNIRKVQSSYFLTRFPYLDNAKRKLDVVRLSLMCRFDLQTGSLQASTTPYLKVHCGNASAVTFKRHKPQAWLK